MSNRLLIALPAKVADQACWLQLGDNGIVDRGTLNEETDLTELSARSHRLPTYVLVPTESVSVHSAKPLGNSAAAKRALKFQIEEQLCNPPEDLHIADAGQTPTGNRRLVAVDKPLMQQWHGRLEAADIRVTSMLPDALALDPATSLTDGSRRLLHHNEQASMLDEPNFGDWCALSDIEQDELQTVRIGGDTPQQWLEAIASAFAPITGDGLLSGEFRLRSQWQRLLRRWRPALFAALAVLALGWGLLWLDNRQLASEVDAYNFEVESIYRNAFPEQRRVVRPRRQMEDFLASAGELAEPPPLLGWLQILSVQSAGIRGASVRELEFQRQPDRLRVTVQVPDYEQLDLLSKALDDAGLTVKRGTVARQDSSVSAELELTGGRP